MYLPKVIFYYFRMVSLHDFGNNFYFFFLSIMHETKSTDEPISDFLDSNCPVKRPFQNEQREIFAPINNVPDIHRFLE